MVNTMENDQLGYVPMYFLVGRKDVNAMAALVEDYYNILQASYKEIIWLESGHGADTAEILDAMINHVLANSPLQTALSNDGFPAHENIKSLGLRWFG
jgi:hypothetical protein